MPGGESQSTCEGAPYGVLNGAPVWHRAVRGLTELTERGISVHRLRKSASSALDAAKFISDFDTRGGLLESHKMHIYGVYHEGAPFVTPFLRVSQTARPGGR